MATPWSTPITSSCVGPSVPGPPSRTRLVDGADHAARHRLVVSGRHFAGLHRVEGTGLGNLRRGRRRHRRQRRRKSQCTYRRPRTRHHDFTPPPRPPERLRHVAAQSRILPRRDRGTPPISGTMRGAPSKGSAITANKSCWRSRSRTPAEADEVIALARRPLLQLNLRHPSWRLAALARADRAHNPANDCLRTGATPLSNGPESKKAVELVVAIYRRLDSGAAVPLPKAKWTTAVSSAPEPAAAGGSSGRASSLAGRRISPAKWRAPAQLPLAPVRRSDAG